MSPGVPIERQLDLVAKKTYLKGIPPERLAIGRGTSVLWAVYGTHGLVDMRSGDSPLMKVNCDRYNSRCKCGATIVCRFLSNVLVIGINHQPYCLY